jgi:2-polyprenyl-3-methyl-5-hydroxy-6-metoxy-1,4-benzoquinol methylase
MIRGAVNMAWRIGRFLDRRRIGSVADFGCGGGRTLFILAKERRGISFHGFDAAPSVVRRNRKRAAELGLSNIRFDHDELPNIRTGESFDLVYSIATLHYVNDVKRAIRNLSMKVNLGGYLVFNYPNRQSMFWYRRHIEPGDQEMRRRFSLLLAGKNLLTLDDIKAVTGRKPHNFWKAVGEKGKTANMCVYIQI